MPEPYTSNTGSTYFNINECRSYSSRVTNSAFAKLSSQVCSEVTIFNKTGQICHIFHNNYTDHSEKLLLKDDESVTIRGITNTELVSAQLASGGPGTLYYRTAYFSSLPQR